MRSLKFRAWDKERKTYDHEEILLAPNGDLLASRWQELCEPESEYIVEQYTGLKDKNGKEIYEGDIVKSSYRITGDSEPTYTYHLVEWGVQPMDDYCGDITVGLWLPDTNEAIEVVGNIHENPELLEEK